MYVLILVSYSLLFKNYNDITNVGQSICNALSEHGLSVR